ncbi:olxA [Rosenbergiella metrosideri]|uniref:olxA n=1 Tax=Rosenbergiella metrosideri TaxID=2921185 RepID=UPI001F4FEDBC|nr:olxA [Rosenbergiella metrosideri]
MTTLVDTVIPQEAYLEEILRGVMPDGMTENNYLDSSLTNIKSLILSQPERYIAYGPWWPALKQLIVESGEYGLGQNIDSDVAAIYSYQRPALTVLSAIIYSAERLVDHIVTDPYHYLDVSESADDTEPYMYVSTDISITKFNLPTQGSDQKSD